jgi:hypothetical protein
MHQACWLLQRYKPGDVRMAAFRKFNSEVCISCYALAQFLLQYKDMGCMPSDWLAEHMLWPSNICLHSTQRNKHQRPQRPIYRVLSWSTCDKVRKHVVIVRKHVVRKHISSLHRWSPPCLACMNGTLSLCLLNVDMPYVYAICSFVAPLVRFVSPNRPPSRIVCNCAC